jgi:hypothetical protein
LTTGDSPVPHPSYAGLTRVSIILHQKSFESRWIAGSSPAMTVLISQAHDDFLRHTPA